MTVAEEATIRSLEGIYLIEIAEINELSKEELDAVASWLAGIHETEKISSKSLSGVLLTKDSLARLIGREKNRLSVAKDKLKIARLELEKLKSDLNTRQALFAYGKAEVERLYGGLKILRELEKELRALGEENEREEDK